jgi:hypothetical protein
VIASVVTQKLSGYLTDTGLLTKMQWYLINLANAASRTKNQEKHYSAKNFLVLDLVTMSYVHLMIHLIVIKDENHGQIEKGMVSQLRKARICSLT